jgi:hypothetical protein
MPGDVAAKKGGEFEAKPRRVGLTALHLFSGPGNLVSRADFNHMLTQLHFGNRANSWDQDGREDQQQAVSELDRATKGATFIHAISLPHQPHAGFDNILSMRDPLSGTPPI